MRSITSVVAVASLLLGSVAARASDSFHDCGAVSRSGKYVLEAKGASHVLKSTAGGAPIAFQVIERTPLRELAGYCIGKGKRYRFSTDIYGLTLEFEVNGTKVQERFRCEMLSDGTPAGIECEREIRSIDWHAPKFESYR